MLFVRKVAPYGTGVGIKGDVSEQRVRPTGRNNDKATDGRSALDEQLDP